MTEKGKHRENRKMLWSQGMQRITRHPDCSTSVLDCMKIAQVSPTSLQWRFGICPCMLCLPCLTVAAVSCMQGMYTRILTYRTSAMGGGSALSGASIEGQPTAFNFCNKQPVSASPHGMHHISPQQLFVQLSDCCMGHY